MDMCVCSIDNKGGDNFDRGTAVTAFVGLTKSSKYYSSNTKTSATLSWLNLNVTLESIAIVQ